MCKRSSSWQSRIHEGAVPQGVTALTIHDLLVAKLTGERLTDPTDAAGWGVADVIAQCWLPGVTELLGVSPGLLPDIAPTGSRAGCVRAEVAATLGLPAGVPVAVALGDNQASFLGCVPDASSGMLLTSNFFRAQRVAPKAR